MGLKISDLFAKPSSDATAPKARIVANYDYADEDGEVLYRVVRYDPKDFRQCRPDSKGGWIWDMKDVGRVPYRLPELVKTDPSEPVFIVEGEKDVESLRSLGLVATCNVGGLESGEWSTTSHSRGER